MIDGQNGEDGVAELADDHLLTTEDNPFDPFTQFDGWNTWDAIHGYHTLSILARITNTSDDLSESDREQAIEDAMDEIVRQNVSGKHLKVSRSWYSAAS